MSDCCSKEQVIFKYSHADSQVLLTLAVSPKPDCVYWSGLAAQSTRENIQFRPERNNSTSGDSFHSVWNKLRLTEQAGLSANRTFTN
jgi:hypothetical protein